MRILIPPGGSLGYHIHEQDIATVRVEGAIILSQNLGGEPAPGGGPAGQVNFSAHSRRNTTHQVTNVGTSHYHIAGFEIMYPEPGRFAPADRPPEYVPVHDNERIRAWRLTLEPGQSTEPITQRAPGLRVVTSGGEAIESVPGQPDRGISLRMAISTGRRPA